jgi:hypothetical protein
MPMVFPTSPTVGQVFSSGGRSWVWTGSTWDSPRTDNLQNLPSLSGGNTFTGVQNFTTPIAVNSGGTGAATLASGGYLKGAGASAITSQSGIPAGDVTSGRLASAIMPAGSILQVVMGTTTTVTSTTSSTGVNTALSVSITPSSASSKMIVLAITSRLHHTHNAASSILRLRRGSTLLNADNDIYFGTSSSGLIVPSSLAILDSPNTTSAIVYGTYIISTNSLNTATVSTRQNIIVMEVAG